MSYNVTSNKMGTSVTILATDTFDINILGDQSQSDIALQDETLTGAYISQIQWACPTSQYIRISRGGFLVGVFSSSNIIDFAGAGMPLTKAANKDLRIEFIGPESVNKGFCNIELQKIFTPLNIPDPDLDNALFVPLGSDSFITSDGNIFTVQF